MADSSAQAADRLRRMAFEGVVEVAVNVYAIMEQVGDALGPLVQQLVLRATDSFVVGQGVAVVADEADMEGKARAEVCSGFLPDGIGIRLPCAFDYNEADPPLHQEAGKSGRHEIEGPDFDGQGNIGGQGCQVVDEVGQEEAGVDAGTGSGELDEAGGGDGAERTHDIQIGRR